MAATTFSQSVTGVGIHNPFIPKSVKIADTVCVSPAAEQHAMQSNTVFQIQGPDGALINAIYDAERSIPGVLRIVRKV